MDKDVDDPFEILGIPHDASDSEAKKAYRKLALKYHPDKQVTEEDKAAAHDIFAKLADAFDTVSDPVKRYDWKQKNEKKEQKNEKKMKKADGGSSHTPSTPATKTPASKPVKKVPAKKVPAKVPVKKEVPTPAAAAPKKKKVPSSGSDCDWQRVHANSVTAPNNPNNPNNKNKVKKHPPTKVVPPPKKHMPSNTDKTNTNPPPKKHAPANKTPPKKHAPANTSAPKKHAPANTTSTSNNPPKKHPPKKKTVTKHQPQQQQQKQYRDPFEIFDSVMKTDYGNNYKEDIASGWQDTKATPGLAKEVKSGNTFFKKFTKNPFKSSEATKEFKKLDASKNKSLSYDELRAYFEENKELWNPLMKLKIGLKKKDCIETATDVAFSLAIGEKDIRPKYRKDSKELSKEEFDNFFSAYCSDEGSDAARHEFFLRTLFCTFDKNGDGVLNRKELGDFLESIFYNENLGGKKKKKSDAAKLFVSGRSLPPKQELISAVQKRLDTNNTRCLQYDELHDLLEVAAHIADVE